MKRNKHYTQLQSKAKLLQLNNEIKIKLTYDAEWMQMQGLRKLKYLRIQIHKIFSVHKTMVS